MRLAVGSPSRAARKLEEALDWLGLAPEAGELCVDLGAAPGGWSRLLLARRARVIAVDTARLSPELLRDGRLKYVCRNAFEFEPDEPADWLFCDLAYRPLEVAGMLGRWARRRWASALVANIKLPMKRKAEMVSRIAFDLERSGWRDLMARQLYHDRDEVTVAARRR
jgi:23S rRNA (cytidine2498-2'-O)-methyltransferase